MIISLPTRHNTDSNEISNTRALRTALALAPTPLASAAALVDGTPSGMIIGSFVGHSLEPALVSISIQKTSTTWPLLRRAEHIGLSILTEANRGALDHFYRPSAERFRDLDFDTDGTAILLPGAALRATTTLIDEVDVGDHILAIARIERAEAATDSHRPLVFHRSTVTTTL
ncbi:flavin reductase family protein [Corynebacterium sanguinis]|uniref:flavin reductase family protein n=1 Tax=Corynebacterium sanguinis TaxID=2594913 RepID=UPI00223A9D96|nr:flavin reductase family protein [Corynebacterium sanguinis]MCT1556293.1 flavin reductase family protein [Corynebacterium sanguinis]MCT1629051.1 flavin reductase family protein [Corynebacterium sanguinis]MCT1664928.1 flavin reductase family protein [Corynebacterium sanguinis]MCT1883493.1 flavin reductase family protein [Corynebacterium sanguinis]MDN8623160.1 flavin reductase family protein [Corynebacterium sanguinis]